MQSSAPGCSHGTTSCMECACWFAVDVVCMSSVRQPARVQAESPIHHKGELFATSQELRIRTAHALFVHWLKHCGCRFNLQYCPPELVDMQRAGISVIQLTTSMEVFNYGLILAEVAGFDRPCRKRDSRYADRLVSMQNEESWVQVSRPARFACTSLLSQQAVL